MKHIKYLFYQTANLGLFFSRKPSIIYIYYWEKKEDFVLKLIYIKKIILMIDVLVAILGKYLGFCIGFS